MEYLAELKDPVLGFSVKPFLFDCLSGKKLYISSRNICGIGLLNLDN